MKSYKIEIVATKTVTITEEMWREEGMYDELDEFRAIQFAKGILIEEMRNNPNRGSARVLSVKED